MAVITISRQAGSQGTAIAREVASRLGWRFVDREVIHIAALEAGVPEQALAELEEEHRRSLVEQVLAAMRTLPLLPSAQESLLREASYPLGAPVGSTLAPTPSALPVSIQDYVRVIEEVVRAIAREPVVLVGRGTQAILADHPQAIHVLIVAPLEARMAHLSKMAQLSRESARQKVEDLDAARNGFLRRHFGVNWLDPLLYDLVINTGRVSPEHSVDVICGLALERS